MASTRQPGVLAERRGTPRPVSLLLGDQGSPDACLACSPLSARAGRYCTVSVRATGSPTAPKLSVAWAYSV